MPKFYTRQLRRPEFDRFLAAAKQSPYFKQVETSGIFTEKGAMVPDLTQYHFRNYGSISFEYNSKDARGFVDQASTLINQVAPFVVRTIAGIGIAESGKVFDPNEETDAEIGFGIDEVGPCIWIRSGSISPGHTDLDYRRQFFNSCFGALGLSADLEAVICEGKLILQANPDRFIFTPIGRRAPAGYNPANANLVLLKVAHPDGSNFHHLMLYLFAADQVRPGVETLTRHFGVEKIVTARLFVVCESEGFLTVRDVINKSGLTPWETTCSIVSDYSIDDLDQAVDRYKSFIMRGFILKVPRTGSIETDIGYSDGNFQFKFYLDTDKVKSIVKLKNVIVELAGTPDIFVPEEDLI